MSKIYDQQTQFIQGSGDTGEATPESIQPLVGGESLWEDPLNRAPENLRRRTETLRNTIDDLRYYADYDRSLLLSAAPGTQFVCHRPDIVREPEVFLLSMTGGPLWVYPALTPGHISGGRPGGARMFTQVGSDWKPYAGNFGTTDLSFTASSLDTGMRGYADADNFAVDTSGVSLGSNRLTISLVPVPTRDGGSANVTATVTGTPRTKITISYGTRSPTTIRDIINFVRDDVGSQGSYGLAHILRASTTSAGNSAPPAVTDAVFQGGYDAEAHQIALTDLTTFFDAVSGSTFINRLREGEGLALSFEPGPVQRSTGTTPRGGRRQALFDAPTDRTVGRVSPDNTRPNRAGWSLFNTGREPEKIPGSVPIGKLLDGKFVFIDGTHVGLESISLGESDTTLERLHRTGPISGASLIGYGGSPHWIPAGTVEEALDNVDVLLWQQTAGDSGSKKIGYDGSATWIPAGTVDSALDTVDTALASQTATTGAARVGYGGSVAWHADSAAPTSLPASTVEVAIDNVVAQLKATDLTVSGGRKVGTSAVTGTGASSGNTSFSLNASSVWGQFTQLLANANGLNSRVIESGHRLTTAAPLRKEFGYVGMPVDGGAVMFQAELHAPGNLYAATPDGYREYASLNLQPIVYQFGGIGLLEHNAVEWSETYADNELGFTTQGSFEAVFTKLPIIANPLSGGTVPLIFVKIGGNLPANDSDGLYTLSGYDTANETITLTRLDGTAPDFSSSGGSVTGTATIMSSIAVGSDESYTRLTAYIRSDLAGSSAGRPWAILGAANRATRILETYTPNESGVGVLKGTLYPDKAVFVGSKRGDLATIPAVVSRDTTNILKYEDKRLLDGNETGAPVNADASHYHVDGGSRLTVAGSYTLSTLQFIDFVAPGGSPHYASSVHITPATGMRITAVLLSYLIRIATTIMTPPSTYHAAHVTVEFGTAAMPICGRVLAYSESMDLTYIEFSGQMIVPLDSAHNFQIRYNVLEGITYLERDVTNPYHCAINLFQVALFQHPDV
jgi:hypothetical protein